MQETIEYTKMAIGDYCYILVEDDGDTPTKPVEGISTMYSVVEDDMVTHCCCTYNAMALGAWIKEAIELDPNGDLSLTFADRVLTAAFVTRKADKF